MTLVAGFKECGIPILLGDFLITGSSDVHRAKKKVHKISPNFAVAWTGYLNAANLVLRDLYQHFAGRRTTRDEVEHYLTNYPTIDLGKLDVRLVGWVIESQPESQPQCFRWNSLWPSELYYDHVVYDGSGADLLYQVKWIGIGPEGHRRDVPALEHAIRHVADLIMHLLTEENIGEDLKKYGFGLGYEFLYFYDSEFHYMPETLFLMLELYMDTDRRFSRLQLYDVCYKYQTIADESLLQIHLFGENGTFAQIISNVWTENPLELAPISGYLNDLRELQPIHKGYKFSLDAPYYSLMFRFLESNDEKPLVRGPIIPASFKRNAIESGEYMKIEDEGEFTKITFSGQLIAWLEETYGAILDDAL